MKNLKIIGIILIVLLFGACSSMSTQFNEKKLSHIAQSGKILNTETQQIISADELINQLSHAQIVIVGEKHDVLLHHHAEQWIIQSLSQKRPQASVVLEMLQANQQDSVTKVQQKFNHNQPLPARQVQKNLKWQQGWDWKAYGGIVMQIFQQGTTLITGNLDSSTMKQIYREQPILIGKLSNQQYVNDILGDTIIKSHKNANVDAMLAVQKHRDREMAKQLLKAAKPTMLIAGNFHARKDLGVPLHLKDINPQISTEIKVVLLVEENNIYNEQQADFIWILK